MRIISGAVKGRRLAAVRGQQTRPTADRVRESLFNILGSLHGGPFVLDLFAGTGALGLEALSRGAGQAVFIDNAARALAVLQKNIQHCGMQARARVIRWDLEKNLNCLRPYALAFGLVFMDPPYGRRLLRPAMGHLLDCGCLAPGAMVVAETSKEEVLSDLPEGLVCQDSRTYGGTRLWFLSHCGLKD